MRCGCPDCGTYMVHADGSELGCVCPACGRRCRDCMGLAAPLSREEIRALARDPSAMSGFFSFSENDENAPFSGADPSAEGDM